MGQSKLRAMLKTCTSFLSPSNMVTTISSNTIKRHHSQHGLLVIILTTICYLHKLEWQIIAQPLVECLNTSFAYYSLSESYKQSPVSISQLKGRFCKAHEETKRTLYCALCIEKGLHLHTGCKGVVLPLLIATSFDWQCVRKTPLLTRCYVMILCYAHADEVIAWTLIHICYLVG